MSTLHEANAQLQRKSEYAGATARHGKCVAEVDMITRLGWSVEKRFPVEDRFSVVLSTFSRVELTINLIQHYRSGTSKMTANRHFVKNFEQITIWMSSFFTVHSMRCFAQVA